MLCNYLVAFKANIVGIAFHGKAFGVQVKPAARHRDGLRLVQPFVLESHERLALHVLKQFADGIQQVVQEIVLYLGLQRAMQRQGETKPIKSIKPNIAGGWN